MRPEEKPAATVILRSDRDASGVRYLDATLHADGVVEINGQDLGRGVAEAFGNGLTEYEWQWTIDAANVPAAITALGGHEGDDLLQLMLAWIREHRTDPGIRIKEAGVPTRFWTRIGD